MKKVLLLTTMMMVLAACSAIPPTETTHTQPTLVPTIADTQQANVPNPPSVHCTEQGFRSEIRTAVDGSQSGVCIFPDGSECDEWAYDRGQCGPVDQSGSASPTKIPTALPIDPALYQQGWWTYKHPAYGFSIMLPEDWAVDDLTTSDSPASGHFLDLHATYNTENIRMSFRRAGEDIPLWPTGVGQGEFIREGTLDVAGQPAQRILLVCPTGEVTAIWYHQAEGQPNIARGDMELGFIYGIGSHCDPGLSLSGKTQRWGEMIIASLKVP